MQHDQYVQNLIGKAHQGHSMIRLLLNAHRLIIRGLQQPNKRVFIESLKNTYHTNLINFHLAFPDKSRAQVRSLSRQVLATYLKNGLFHLAPEMWSGFVWDRGEVLEDAISQGKGVVVVSKHMGPHRFPFVEFANRGHKVNAAISKSAASRVFPWLDWIGANLDGRNGAIDGKRVTENIRIILVEEPSCALKMVRALRRGEIVLFDLDGNVGVGGTERTVQDTFKLPLLDREIHVRRGAAYLSYKTGAPIVPIVPLWQKGHRAILKFYDLMNVREGEALADYCVRTLGSLYGVLDQHLRAFPSQWENWVEFYKWVSPTNDNEQDPEILSKYIEDFRRGLNDPHEGLLKVRAEDAIIIKIRGHHVLIDIHRFRFFIVSKRTKETFKLLYKGISPRDLLAEMSNHYLPEMILGELAWIKANHLFREQAA